MKEIILVRHGKSSWEYEGVSDRDRPIAERGIGDAILVSKSLKDKIGSPDAVFSSPAIRALHTCMIFMRNLDIDPSEVVISDELYDFGGKSVINFLRKLNEGYKKVMIFGHNHAFTSISNIFGNKPIDNLPTSGVVKINFDVSKWERIEKGNTEIIVFPKQLK